MPSLPQILADPGPAPGEGYDETDPHLLTLWSNVQTHLTEYTSVSSHSTEGTAYTRDLTTARELLFAHYEAYLLRKSYLTAAPGTDPLLLQTTRSRGVRYDNIAMDQL